MSLPRPAMRQIFSFWLGLFWAFSAVVSFAGTSTSIGELRRFYEQSDLPQTVRLVEFLGSQKDQMISETPEIFRLALLPHMLNHLMAQGRSPDKALVEVERILDVADTFKGTQFEGTVASSRARALTVRWLIGRNDLDLSESLRSFGEFFRLPTNRYLSQDVKFSSYILWQGDFSLFRISALPRDAGRDELFASSHLDLLDSVEPISGDTYADAYTEVFDGYFRSDRKSVRPGLMGRWEKTLLQKDAEFSGRASRSLALAFLDINDVDRFWIWLDRYQAYLSRNLAKIRQERHFPMFQAQFCEDSIGIGAGDIGAIRNLNHVRMDASRKLCALVRD